MASPVTFSVFALAAASLRHPRNAVVGAAIAACKPVRLIADAISSPIIDSLPSRSMNDHDDSFLLQLEEVNQLLMDKPLPPGLHVVATPIGNLGDLSPRAAATLRDASL